VEFGIGWALAVLRAELGGDAVGFLDRGHASGFMGVGVELDRFSGLEAAVVGGLLQGAGDVEGLELRLDWWGGG